MILQFGFESQIDNLITLIGTEDLQKSKNISTLGEVQTEYRSLIRRMQKRIPGGQPGSVNVITDVEQAKLLRPLFVNDSLLDDKAQADVITEMQNENAFEKRDLILRAINEIGLYSESIGHSLTFSSPTYSSCHPNVPRPARHRKLLELYGPIRK